MAASGARQRAALVALGRSQVDDRGTARLGNPNPMVRLDAQFGRDGRGHLAGAVRAIPPLDRGSKVAAPLDGRVRAVRVSPARRAAVSGVRMGCFEPAFVMRRRCERRDTGAWSRIAAARDGRRASLGPW